MKSERELIPYSTWENPVRNTNLFFCSIFSRMFGISCVYITI
jgi:hypothetical protein